MRVWFSPIPIIAVACLLLVVLVVLTVMDSARSRMLARWLIVLTVGGILAVTLVASASASASASGDGVPNLVPGHTISAQLTNPHYPLGAFNVVGNLAMFVPVGWLLALVTTRRRLLLAALVGFGLSAAIEILQLFTGRVSDIDDVMLNGAGAVLGACVALLILRCRSGDVRT